MPAKKHTYPSVPNRVVGGILGALIGAIWAFLRTWEASADYFNRQGRGWVVVGILLGWVPGGLAALAGLVYGLWKGGKMGLLPGILATLRGVENYLEKFANSSRPDDGSDGRPLDWQRLELLPPPASRVRAKTNSGKKVRIMEHHQQVRFFDPDEPPIHVGPLKHENKRSRSRTPSQKSKNGQKRALSPPATYNPPSRRVATSSNLYLALGSRKTARQRAEEEKREKPQHPKHKRRSRSASP